LCPAGQLGFIVSNAFATREFGKPLVQVLFPSLNLQKVMDCSGLLFPGHGTPTCLLFGSNERPVPEVPIRVSGVLPGGGDLRTPPEDSLLWDTLARHHNEPGYSDSRVVVADRPRQDMAHWPWSFDASAEMTQKQIEAVGSKNLRSLLSEDVGFDVIFGT